MLHGATSQRIPSPDQARLLKRGFGWLLCKHKKNLVSFDALYVAPERTAGPRVCAAPALKCCTYNWRTLSFLPPAVHQINTLDMNPLFVILSSTTPWRRSSCARWRLDNRPMCLRSGRGRCVKRDRTRLRPKWENLFPDAGKCLMVCARGGKCLRPLWHQSSESTALHITCFHQVTVAKRSVLNHCFGLWTWYGSCVMGVLISPMAQSQDLQVSQK